MKQGVIVQCACCGCYVAAKEAIEDHDDWFCSPCYEGECECDEPEIEQ